MSAQQEVNLFLKNESKTVQKQVKTIKLFVDKKYKNVLRTKYVDEFVVVKTKTRGSDKMTIKTAKSGKCKILIAPSNFNKIFELDSESVYEFDDSKLEMFFNNFDNFVNAFRNIVESYSPSQTDFANMTTFGANSTENNKPMIAIEKIDESKSVTIHDTGYYVSDKIKSWIRSKGSDRWSTPGFQIEVCANRCRVDDDNINLGVRTDRYVSIDSDSAGLDQYEQKCFIDNFDKIVQGFKALNDAFKSQGPGFDTSSGIVF